jgi:membrane-bound PQQ-dependent dehydrogenase (glucose/quinate/shikimate family)
LQVAGGAIAPPSDWVRYGNNDGGARYARLDQITPANVANLKPIWTIRTGVQGAFKATPIQVRDTLYLCAGANVLMALDAETGAQRWRHDPHVKAPPIGNFGTSCRGVSYYRAPDGYKGDCPERILTGTTDARLIAVDARTGESCKSFGENGQIDLKRGMGPFREGMYFVTSPPTIAGHVAVVGGWVADNVSVGEPSGVVRAFDTITGKLVWAWDLGRPGLTTEPPPGETYTPGTPNVWSIGSYDPKLNLVYLPTGNATPDYFGAERTKEMEKYNSSTVALDAATGAVRWSFQTVHHDIWDYDAPSQPVLVDLPTKDGSIVPALVQPTKRGELFLLDRRDGRAVATIEEKPVPQGGAKGEWTAKTQPFSTGLPNFRPDLTEKAMWGLTPLDQLWCRTEFRKLRYEGHLTPPMVTGSLQFPGNAGGFNWGSVAVDEDRHLLVAAPLVMANRVQLIPRAEMTKGVRASPQLGTPYGARTEPFMSPLFVPCQQPPYGRLAVIDLETGKLLWSKPIGAANESGPLGLATGLPLTMGVPLQAGSIVTKSGLIFIGGTMDKIFRAVDVSDGKVLWRARLPGAAQATPMTYLSPQTKRQIVVLTVPAASRGFPGARRGRRDAPPEDPKGGYVIAYALPARS